MRPNSKTFNQNHGFSSQRQQQPFRAYQAKSKACDLDRWDHSGFDQLQSEQDRFSKSTKSQKDQIDLTSTSDSIDIPNTTKHSEITNEATKQAQETQTSLDTQPSNSTQEIQKEAPKLARKERRPDRQLYSVRQKCTTNARTEEVRRMKEMTIQCSERLNCSIIEKREDYSPYPQAVKDVLTAFEDKDHYPHEDDKLSISNVSTAMSDPLKNWEEESYMKSEAAKERMDTTADMSQHAHSSEISSILFDMVLETENGTINVRIAHGEEDYEAYLDNLCNTYNFDAKMRLYFKINVVQLINESTTTTEESEKVEALLDKLLDINYKLLMYESGYGEIDEGITPYIVDSKKTEASSAVLESFVHCA